MATVMWPQTPLSPLHPQASVSPDSYTLSKCFLPEESTVIGVYCSAGACLLLLFLAHCLWMKGLLQCLCLLGKHKSLWTTSPRPHHVREDRAIEWCATRGSANVTLPLLICSSVSLHCEGHESIFLMFISTDDDDDDDVVISLTVDVCQISSVLLSLIGTHGWCLENHEKWAPARF